MADRIGRQTPTENFVLPYQKTDGAEAIACYGKSGREAMDWQKQGPSRSYVYLTKSRASILQLGHLFYSSSGRPSSAAYISRSPPS